MSTARRACEIGWVFERGSCCSINMASLSPSTDEALAFKGSLRVPCTLIMRPAMKDIVAHVYDLMVAGCLKGLSDASENKKPHTLESKTGN